MERISRLKHAGRVAALVLLLVAVAGPWAYTGDGVPPPEYCHEPNFLLASGYCAGPTSAIEIMFFLIPAFFYMFVGLFTGEVVLPERAREFFGVFLLILLLLLLILPILTTLFRLAGRNSRPWHRFQLAAWGVAGFLSLLPPIFDAELRSGRFWGIYLYFGLALGVVIIEAVGWKDGSAQ